MDLGPLCLCGETSALENSSDNEELCVPLLLCNFWSLCIEDCVFNLFCLVDFDPFGGGNLHKARISFQILWCLKSSRSSVFSGFFVVAKARLRGDGGTPVLYTIPVLANSCVKSHKWMVSFTSCLINLATIWMNKRLNKFSFKIKFINFSDFDPRSEHSNIVSSAPLRMRKAITIVSGNRADAILVPFEAALSPNFN